MHTGPHHANIGSTPASARPPRPSGRWAHPESPMIAPGPHDDDNALVRAMALGDQRALALLYDRHIRSMLAIGVHMLQDTGEAEDVAHDVFLQAWNKAVDFDQERGSVRSWLLIRMRSRCLDRIRARAVRRDVDVEDAPKPAPSPAPDATSGKDDDKVRAAMGRLPEAQRQVIELVYFQGMTSQDAAQTLGCPTGTIKSRVRLAMQSLRQELAPQESP